MRKTRSAIKLPAPLPGLSIRMESAPTLQTIAATVDSLNRTFAEFRAKNDERLAELAKGRDDVVTRATTDNLNNAISGMQAELTALNRRMQLGQSEDDNEAGSAASRAYYQNFVNKFVRRGIEAELPALAVQAAMTSDSDADGGFLVPEQLEAGISRVALTVNAMRSLADVQTIGTSMSRRLKNLGGAGAQWLGEKDARTTQTATPQLAEIKIPVHEMEAMPGVTQATLDDASEDVGALLESEIAIAFADLEGAAFVSGDGVGKPRGFLAYDMVANASYAWGKVGYIATTVSGAFGGSANADGPKNLIDLFYALKPVYRSSASFVANDATIGEIRKLKDSAGFYLWHPATGPGEPATVMGKPIVTEDNMPAIGANKYAIAFGDFKQGYGIRDRIGMRVLRDPYTAKPYVLFYTTKRVGGGVTDFAAIKLLKFGTS